MRAWYESHFHVIANHLLYGQHARFHTQLVPDVLLNHDLPFRSYFGGHGMTRC
jgi:hypothetical protein